MFAFRNMSLILTMLLIKCDHKAVQKPSRNIESETRTIHCAVLLMSTSYGHSQTSSCLLVRPRSSQPEGEISFYRIARGIHRLEQAHLSENRKAFMMEPSGFVEYNCSQESAHARIRNLRYQRATRTDNIRPTTTAYPSRRP